MAAFTAAKSSVAIPSFTGLRVDSVKAVPPKSCSFSFSSKGKGKEAGVIRVKASMNENVSKMGAALVAAAATSVMMASNANAVEVLMGGNGGELEFIPKNLSVAAGETIVFKNNAGFPHNVIFDEDNVPDGVDVTKISMNEEDLLNAPGETYKVTLDKKGTYKFYCGPHQGTGMAGIVTVS